MKQNRQKDKLTDQARRFFNAKYNGMNQKKEKGTLLLHGRRTLNEQIRIVGKAAFDMNVKRLKHITPEMAQTYLSHCKDKGLTQKYLSTIKRSLERIVYAKEPEKKLEHVVAISKTIVSLTDKDRAYSNEQIIAIMNNLSSQAKLSTLIAYNAGLRVEELLTIRRTNESSSSPNRVWNNNRFTGRSDGVRYIVTGKNGLKREEMLDKELAIHMEQYRLNTPKIILDRKEPFMINYDLLGGKRFSAAFSEASYKILGWSHGAHGLRFSYAQRRMDKELLHMKYSEAKLIVSQELGHFREYITERYIDPYK